MGVAPEPESDAWKALTGSLGLAGCTLGQRRNTPASAPLPVEDFTANSDLSPTWDGSHPE